MFRMRGRRPEERQFRINVMMYIKFGPGTKLTVEGHAGYAPIGNDIVCAGASALYYTFLACCDAKERVEGNIRILEAEPVYKNRVVFEAVRTGLMILAENYPDNIRILNTLP